MRKRLHKKISPIAQGSTELTHPDDVRNIPGLRKKTTPINWVRVALYANQDSKRRNTRGTRTSRAHYEHWKPGFPEVGRLVFSLDDMPDHVIVHETGHAAAHGEQLLADAEWSEAVDREERTCYRQERLFESIQAYRDKTLANQRNASRR